MIYPDFLKKSDLIGICALSSGVGKKINDYEISLNVLKDNGYKVIEEGNVRSDDIRSDSAINRAKALNNLFLNDEVKFIMCASGGEFLYEILPFINVDLIKNNPKFFMGASDPTSICFMLTTCLDIATIYGLNAGSYDFNFDYVNNNLEIIKGNMITQKSFKLYGDKQSFITDRLYNQKVSYKGNDISVKGRCIGGCLDVLKDLIGTKYENTLGFIEKYKEDGIVWYFDIFSMSSENVYRTLLQMKYIGWFKYCKLVIFGRVLFDSSDTGMSYEDAYSKSLDNIPYIYDTDIGHTYPKMTLINGSIIEVDKYQDKGEIKFNII